jgi:hypothetical protein
VEVAAVLSDPREQEQAGGGDRERGGERPADAVTVDQVPAGVRPGSGCKRERDEGEAGRQRPLAEDELQ